MEIIDELEPTKRGLYGGACGYISFAGDMDVAIAIRTGIVKDQMLYVQAAAGVVADSVPELEWKETEAKARALLRAAELVEGGLVLSMKLLMIDNYDSFTYNLVQYFGELGAEVRGVPQRRDHGRRHRRAASRDALVISPGPCSPAEAGISVAAIQHFAGKLPILGVCLGHQAIGAAFGGKIVRAQQLMHGKTSEITTTREGVFAGLPEQFTVNRYHSLAIERESCPAALAVTAWTDDGEIMGVRHRELATTPLEGVQFHPESILTEHGHAMLKNFLEQQCHEHAVDLRSDTVTRPTAAMRAAMVAAPLGDDVFGDDPSVNALQEKIAAMLGFEAALFVPTGTQSNLCAILATAGAATSTSSARWRTATAGKAAARRCSAACSRSRWTTRPTARWRWPRSRPRSSRTTRTSRARGCWRWRTPGRQAAAVRLRASGDRAGRSARAWRASRRRAAVQCRGGAGCATGATVRARSAPHRAMLRQRLGLLQQGPGRAGRLGAVRLARVHRRAHRIRKMAGGGMRQAGVLAAAALYALDHHVDRLAQDHALARRLAEGLQGHPRPDGRAAADQHPFVDSQGSAPPACWRT